MAREDSKYNEAIHKTWGRKKSEEWTSLPLLVLEDKWATECIATMNESSYSEITPHDLFATDSWLPWFDFVVIVDFMDPPMNYWRIKRLEDGLLRITMVYLNAETNDAPLIHVDVPFFDDGEYRFMRGEGKMLPDKYPDNVKSYLEYAIWASIEGNVAIKAAEEALKVTTAFLKWLHTTDYYPVEMSAEKRTLSSVHKNKPWKRRDLTRIVFLNKFPSTETSETTEGSSNESTGGGKKCGHPRTGHYRTMRAERFKSHPLYKKRRWFKAIWVGPTETTYKGNRYKVLLPPDRFLE